MHFQNIRTFTYHKTFLHTLLLLVFKIVQSLNLRLKFRLCYIYSPYHLDNLDLIEKI